MRKGRRVLNGLLLLLMLVILSACGVTTEDVKTRMEKHLYEKYGEEFVVDRIGQRSANGQKFYQARIYPKSIIGTNREGDSYYYASASIDLLFGGSKLDEEVGDSYSFINRNDDVENYLLPKAKEIFGDRIRLKTDIKYKKRVGDSEHFAWYKKSNFDEALNDVRNDKEDKIRFEVAIYIYIFDRIDSEKEKEKRRGEVYEYLKYLKKENLFEYLEMGVIFIDERVLAPSYEKYEEKIEYSEKEEKEVGDKTIYLPVKEFREEMSKTLEIEINKMDEEDKLKSMNKILKSNLEVYRGSEYLRGSTKDSFWVESLDFLKEVDMYNGYEEAKETGTLNRHYYKTVDDIEDYEFNHYILLEEER